MFRTLSLSYIIISMLLCSSPSVFADDAGLTSEETVNYINKKSEDCAGRKIGETVHIRNLSLSHSEDGNIRISVFASNYAERSAKADYVEYYVTTTFHPSKIDSITDMKLDGSNEVGKFVIKLNSKSATVSNQGYSYTIVNSRGLPDGFKAAAPTSSKADTVDLLYFSGDAANSKRLQNALNRLKKLAQAEGDPFDE